MLKMTQLVEPLVQESGDAGKVKSKKNNTKDLKAGAIRKHKKRASGIAAGSAEVMVKISSYGKGGGHVKAHLMYISRHSNADAEKIAFENEFVRPPTNDNGNVPNLATLPLKRS